MLSLILITYIGLSSNTFRLIYDACAAAWHYFELQLTLPFVSLITTYFSFYLLWQNEKFPVTSSCQGVDGQICVDRQYAQASRKTERQNADIDFGPVQDFPGLIIHRHCHFCHLYGMADFSPRRLMGQMTEPTKTSYSLIPVKFQGTRNVWAYVLLVWDDSKS